MLMLLYNKNIIETILAANFCCHVTLAKTNHAGDIFTFLRFITNLIISRKKYVRVPFFFVFKIFI